MDGRRKVKLGGDERQVEEREAATEEGVTSTEQRTVGGRDDEGDEARRKIGSKSNTKDLP